MARSGSDCLEAVRQLLPEIEAQAARIERERRLPERLVRALVEAGLFRMLVPRALGGGEVDLATFARVIELLAAADASTAWCVSQGAGSALIAAHMDPTGAADIFGDPRAIVARGPGKGSARPAPGGYRVTGAWSFASGCRHATWLSGLVDLAEASGRGRVCTVFFPADRAQLTDTWDVIGLRGTGSDSFAVTDLFVPDRHTVGGGGRRWADGPLYAFSSNAVYAAGFASVALGIARATLDAFVDLAGAKTPRLARHVLREQPVVQAQTARAEAAVGSARAFLHEAIGEAWAAASAAGELPMAARVRLRLAATHAIHSAAGAVDTLYHAAGATAIFAAGPFERRFRDVHAVTQQIQGSQAHFETAGRFRLGLPPDTAML